MSYGRSVVDRVVERLDTADNDRASDDWFRTKTLEEFRERSPEHQKKVRKAARLDREAKAKEAQHGKQP